MKLIFSNLSISSLLLNSFKMANIPSVDLSSMRKPYKTGEDVLNETELLTKNPLTLFHHWFETAKQCQTIYEPNAVCLATANEHGIPSARMVLLKSYGLEGFKIFTNYESRKGKELCENPNAALLFYWDAFNRQVRIEGKVEKVPEEESKEYFSKRPRQSQLSAMLSNQSEVVESRDVLVQRYKELDAKHSNQVPKPTFWGGFVIIPDNFEFWQGQSNRLHDRIRFRRKHQNEIVDNKMVKLAEDEWVFERLQP